MEPGTFGLHLFFGPFLRPLSPQGRTLVSTHLKNIFLVFFCGWYEQQAEMSSRYNDDKDIYVLCG